TVRISRSRNDSDGLLQVTGRDVPEADYAMHAIDGHWTLAGDLEEAAALAKTAKVTAGLGDDGASVVELVQTSPNGIRAKEIAKELGIRDDAVRQHLVRAESA